MTKSTYPPPYSSKPSLVATARPSTDSESAPVLSRSSNDLESTSLLPESSNDLESATISSPPQPPSNLIRTRESCYKIFWLSIDGLEIPVSHKKPCKVRFIKDEVSHRVYLLVQVSKNGSQFGLQVTSATAATLNFIESEPNRCWQLKLGPMLDASGRSRQLLLGTTKTLCHQVKGTNGEITQYFDEPEGGPQDIQRELQFLQLTLEKSWFPDSVEELNAVVVRLCELWATFGHSDDEAGCCVIL